ncbi:MAG: DUF86 domain-containing protein [Candidatus Moraniibacteriota bacterium]|nr:MAG: DUF86 domain-containing protein [Candidatus Moranbacteria bacterium]
MDRNKLHLYDILQAIEKVERYLNNVDFVHYSQDEILTDAIARQLGIMGEATNRLSQEFREKYPEQIPYKSMIGMRNFLVHDYAKVDRKILWETAKKDLPNLKKSVSSLLNQLNEKI